MNINIGNLGASFKSSHANAINPHANKISPTNQNNKEGRFDRIELSPSGNMLKSFSEQKEQLAEKRSELIKNTLANGGSMKDIETQLKNYDLQVEGIDEQINDILKSQIEETTEEDKVEKPKDTKPKTEEEIQNDKLNHISNLSSGIDLAEIVTKAKRTVNMRATLLQREIDDGLGNVARKKVEVAGLKEKSAELSVDIGKRLVAVQDKIVETNKESAESIKEPKPSENTENNTDNNTDKSENTTTSNTNTEKTTTSEPKSAEPENNTPSETK